jgi:hypothetical protein
MRLREHGGGLVLFWDADGLSNTGARPEELDFTMESEP